jgi:hypothetical protein
MFPSGAPAATPLRAAFVPPLTASPGDVLLAGAGDIARCGSGLANAQRTGDLMRALPNATIFAAGDDAYPDGRATDFANCYDAAWGSFNERTLPSPGNHDHHTKNLAGYFGYFAFFRTHPKSTHYSVDLKDWHIVSLDSGAQGLVGTSAKHVADEARWLEEDLKATDKRCILAFWHHPRFSSGFHGSDKNIAALWRVLLAHHADVVVNGHDHDYERFAPQDANGKATADGITQFVAGTGGDDLRGFGTLVTNSVAHDNGHFGVLMLALRPAGFEWTFVATDGAVLDRSDGVTACHAK